LRDIRVDQEAIVMRAHPLLLAALALMALAVTSGTGYAQEREQVTVNSPLAGLGAFTALLLRPPGAGPFPAIIALHGCGGLLNREGELARRETDWANRLVGAGYVVLFPDSFTARGFRQICTAHDRAIFPRDRAGDVAAATEWLAKQPFVDSKRLGLMGWSHGAMTALWAVRSGFMAGAPQFKTAIAFYPGCREIARLPDWRPRVPLTLLIGGADDWTQPGPCRELAQRAGFKFIEYPGAYHGFDAPKSKVRVRKGLGAVKGGEAHVGTDPVARPAAIKEVMNTLWAALGKP
jgi:dienelactone hydrolase